MLEAAAPVSNRHRRSVRFVALERQHVPIEHKLHGAFTRLICSSAYTLGEEVERFEADFAAYSEVEQCVGVASGTAALVLILQAYGIAPGDEVIVPAHTFIGPALAEELSLPMHPDLLSEEIESVVEAVHAALPASLPAPESVLC